jgi:hypothetical protein
VKLTASSWCSPENQPKNKNLVDHGHETLYQQHASLNWATDCMMAEMQTASPA